MNAIVDTQNRRSTYDQREALQAVHRAAFPDPPITYGRTSPRPSWEPGRDMRATWAARVEALRNVQPATAGTLADILGIRRGAAHASLVTMASRGMVRREGSVLVNGAPADLWWAV